MSTSAAPSINPSAGSSSASYLNDDLKNQEHQSTSATTAQGLSLSGSLTLDAADIATNTPFPSLSQGEEITNFGADNCLPPAVLNDITSFTNSMATICATQPQLFALMQSILNTGQSNLNQFLQNLTTMGFLQGSDVQISNDAQVQDNQGNGNQVADDGVTQEAGLGAGASDGTVLSSAQSYANSYAQTGNESGSVSETDSGDSTSQSGTDSINIQTILDDVALLINQLNNCTATYQQAMIQQNQAQTSAMITAAQDIGKSAQGPLSAAWASLALTLATTGFSVAAMGYSSNEASDAEDQQVAQQNDQTASQTENSANLTNQIAKQANSDDEIDSTQFNKNKVDMQAQLNAPKSTAVAKNAQESLKSANSTSRLVDTHNARVGLQKAQTTVSGKLAKGEIPSEEDLTNLENATKNFQTASSKVNPSDVEDMGEFQGNVADATKESNALVASGRAKRSTEAAVNHPDNPELQQKATDDIQTARDVAKGTKGEAFINDSMDHCSDAKEYAQYKGKTEEEFENFYNAKNGTSGKPPISAEDAANNELKAPASTTAKEVQESIAETTKPLGAIKKNIGEALGNNAVQSSEIAENASLSARCFNGSTRDQTEAVNKETQKLAVLTRRATDQSDPEYGPELHSQLNNQIDKTRETINNNPDAHPEVVTQAKIACNISQGASEDLDMGYTGYLRGKGLSPSSHISNVAKDSQSATSRVLSKQTTGKTGGYYQTFQNVYGLFNAISTINQAGSGILNAEGQAQQAAMQQAKEQEEAEATSYGYGEQASQQNAQLQEQTLQSLESTYQSISQSQTQDVQFVRGAN